MDHLRSKRVAFGTSVTLTRHNCFEVVSDEFADFLIEKGVLYVWGFYYVPIGRNPDFSLRLTPQQRAKLVNEVRSLRERKPIMYIDFWNDAYATQGCIAGGRRFFHIAADGAAEPCVFAHFSNMNIKDHSISEVLQSPIFRAYQKRQPFNENMLQPCPILDNPQFLREMVAESNAMPTHAGAESILTGRCAEMLDQYARQWAELSVNFKSGK